MRRLTSHVMAFESDEDWDYPALLREAADWLDENENEGWLPSITALAVDDSESGSSLVMVVDSLRQVGP